MLTNTYLFAIVDEMTIRERMKRDLKIAKYLATAMAYNPNGTPIYPSIDQAHAEFMKEYNLSTASIHRLKMKYLGKDEGVERNLRPEYQEVING